MSLKILAMRGEVPPAIPQKSTQRRRPLTLTMSAGDAHMSLGSPATPTSSIYSISVDNTPQIGGHNWSPRAVMGAFASSSAEAEAKTFDSARWRRHRSMGSSGSSSSGELPTLKGMRSEHEVSRRAYLANKMARRQQRLDALNMLQPGGAGSRLSYGSANSADVHGADDAAAPYSHQSMATLRKSLQLGGWGSESEEDHISSDDGGSSHHDSRRHRLRGPDSGYDATLPQSSAILAWNEHVQSQREALISPAAAAHKQSNYTYL
ncbi:hypothetical protein PYCC9005_004444 [Savitreella phatthalungensis]